jgi:hypothetical protein
MRAAARMSGRGSINRARNPCAVRRRQEIQKERAKIKKQGNDKVSPGDGNPEPREARSACLANCRSRPDGGRGGESSDPVLADNNDAGTDEAFAVDDLRGDTGGGKNNPAVDQNISETALRNR